MCKWCEELKKDGILPAWLLIRRSIFDEPFSVVLSAGESENGDFGFKVIGAGRLVAVIATLSSLVLSKQQTERIGESCLLEQLVNSRINTEPMVYCLG